MNILAKLAAPSAQPRKTATRPDGLDAYRAGASRLASVARESGLRFQRQWIIAFVAAIAMLALLAGLYLNVTASASIAGRQIQNIEANIITNEQVNADLETHIATLMANTVLEERAKAMGFEPVDRTKLEYMIVPGYFPPGPASMVSAEAPAEILANSPEFNETLIDWVSKQIEAASLPLYEVKH